jgi:hypothetical protein
MVFESIRLLTLLVDNGRLYVRIEAVLRKTCAAFLTGLYIQLGSQQIAHTSKPRMAVTV